MIINGVELDDIDIFDAETAEKCEVAFEKVVEEAKKTEGLKNSVAIRRQCMVVFNCFNEIFGEGTDKKLFGDKVNLLVCLKAFEELMEYTKERTNELEKYISKYSPNRSSRRK